MKKTSFPLLLFSMLLSLNCLSQGKKSGPVIQDFGPVWEISEPDFQVDTQREYKAVFDIMYSPESPGKMNKGIETAARFLNMHAQAGVPRGQLSAALIVHHTASKDVLDNTAYKNRFGTHNPNAEMIHALLEAGVQIIFCGQSSKSRGIPRDQLINGVQISLSAMTALIQLQDEGYRLIKF